MSKPTFSWNPDLGAELSNKPLVNVTKFGDGYELRVANGVNTKPRAWQVTFTRMVDEAVAIITFLESRGALDAFTWTDPLNKEGSYVCREWTSSQEEFGVYKISATFEQVFEQ